MIENPVFQVTAEGISAPTYPEILEYYKGKVREIFGEDVNLDADTQDGQLIALFAFALHQCNEQAVSLYAQYNPSTASGVGLETAVKVNGLERKRGTKSTVDLQIVGTFGTILQDCIASDGQNRWLIPYAVIPQSGVVVATAVAEDDGEIEADPGTITQIETPTYGWDGVNNPGKANVGGGTETDAELRERQTVSTENAGVAVWDSLIGNIRALDGVDRVSGVVNNTAEVDANGIPPHSVAMVVDGGDATEVAEVIYTKKGVGVGTYGSTFETITDSFGNDNLIKFSRPLFETVRVSIKLTPKAGYLSTTPDELAKRAADYINGLGIGASVNSLRVLSAIVKTDSGMYDQRFDVKDIKLNNGYSVAIAWNQIAVAADSIDVTVVD